MKKKANVPVVLLVLGVFAVCSLALLTFIVSEFNTNNSFVGVDFMKELNFKIDEYDFYKSQGVSESKINKELNVTIEGNKKFIYVEKTGKKFLKKEELLFSVKYQIP